MNTLCRHGIGNASNAASVKRHWIQSTLVTDQIVKFIARPATAKNLDQKVMGLHVALDFFLLIFYRKWKRKTFFVYLLSISIS